MIKVFNWIFVAIAGSIILLFFFKIIAIHTSISEKESTAKLISSFDSLLNKVSSSSRTQNFITLPDKKFTFSCKKPCTNKTGCDSYLSIERSDVEVKFPVQVILTPEKFQTSRLYSFTLPWDVPFYVTDFLILSPAEQKIIINCNGNLQCERVLSKIPSYFKSAGIVTSSGVGKTVSFSSCSSQTADICVKSDKIVFKDGSEFNYFSDEEVIAAIFSSSPNFYDCSMNKAYYKMNSVASILNNKKRFLFDSSPQPNCRNKLNEMDLSPYGVEFNSFKNDNSGDLFRSMSTIQNYNNYLRVGSCGALY